MHEYGIVQSVLDLVDQQVRANAGRQAVRVILSVGGTVEEGNLRHAFDTFKLGTTASDAELIIEPAPGRDIYLKSVEIEV